MPLSAGLHLCVRSDHLVGVGDDANAVAEEEDEDDVDGDAGEGHLAFPQHCRLVLLTAWVLESTNTVVLDYN